MSLDTALSEAAKAVEEQLDLLLPLPAGPERRVYEAMRYSTLNGGKRLRPFLVLESAKLFNVARSCALRVAAAVEMIHSYSLVHDDLPAMDNSALRRGRATTHVEFDEATAVLAGDGLLTRAFEVLGEAPTHGDASVRAELVVALAAAAGPAGMVGGQMFDLLAEHDKTLDIGAITRLQRMKTGDLIAFSSGAGAILGKAPHSARVALHAYAHDLGLAFQIADDLLDVEGDAAQVGKDIGKDTDAGKATFVSILGVERAREQAEILAKQAAFHVEQFCEKANLLIQVAEFVVKRKS